MIVRSRKAIKVILFILFTLNNVVQCFGKYKPIGRVKTFDSSGIIGSAKSPWIKESEDDTGESFFPPAPSQNNRESMDKSINQILETVSTNENYLKKILAYEQRTKYANTDIEKVNDAVTKKFDDLKKQLEIQNTQEKEFIKELKNLRQEITKVVHVVNEVKISPEKKSSVVDEQPSFDLKCESKLNNVEDTLKVLTDSVEQMISSNFNVKNRGNLRNNRRTDIIGTLPDNLSTLVHEFKRVLRDKSGQCECKSMRSFESYPADCHEIQNLGFNISGIYKVKPEDYEAFYVLCDMNSAGGGWTVFQNRFDGSQDFYKPWVEYKYGFGNLAGEFWLGLEKIHYLSNQKLYELRIELDSHSGTDAHAAYTVFNIGPEVEGYRISTIGSFSGDAGDSLSYHSGQKFTTFDADNDEWRDGVCAVEHGGAWWYRECDKSNLNGKYLNKPTFKNSQGIYWNTFKGPTNFLSRTRMMIRPLPVSRASHSLEGTVSSTVTSTKFTDLTRKSALKRGRRPKINKVGKSGKIPFIPVDEPQVEDVRNWAPED